MLFGRRTSAARVFAMAATKSSRPLQPSKEERRLSLARHFIAAVAPMLEAGEQYADISVARLIEEVGVSRSTFYSYFDDKAALLVAMAEDVTIDLAEAGSSWFDLAGASGPEDLHAALRPLFTTYHLHRQLLRAITDAAPYDEGIAALHRVLVERASDGLKAHLGAVESDDVDVERTSAWLVWMLERGLYQLVADADEDERERQLDAVAGLIWRLVYSR